ncbi:thiamine kinase-like enzyme [Bacilli bacterium PM5-3]|nr:thiamine kinase-like enzyme [Bacilli bacterium PM5-3]MDH6603993.1 thiamine kinase-like enzyme [Bacilli bacterium PM5-9]
MNEQIIKDFIKERLNKDAIVIERLMGGMSNYTYLIEIEGEKYTFRIPGKGAEHFTNRKKEIAIMKEIEEYDFLPAPIINDEQTGYKVALYVEGKPLSEITPKPYELVAQMLKKLHNAPKFMYDYEPLKRLEKYERITSGLDPVYVALKEKWLDIYDEILSKVELVASHGDSQTSNFVLGDKRLFLMDWEFAANNDPIYDIACFGNANFEEAIQLIEEYYESAGKKEYQRLYAWRMFQCLQWHNVAKYKQEIGLSEELSVDFDFIANAYLDKAKGFFQDFLDVSKGE